MKKILAIIGIVVLVLVVVVVLFLGQIIKTAIQTAGPKVAGVDITVEKVRVSPIGGTVHIEGLIIGNPEGFKTPSAMELGEFKLNIALGSLFTDTIVIKQILIEAPEITYERGLKSSNLSTLLDNLAPEEADEPTEGVAEKPKKAKSAGKKVVIEDFQLNNAQVNATFTAMGGKKFPLKLGSIQMKDIGKKSDGASITDVITEVLGTVTTRVGTAASDVLKGAGGLAGDTLSGAGGAVKDVGGAATDAAKDAAGALKKGIGGLFGKE